MSKGNISTLVIIIVVVATISSGCLVEPEPTQTQEPNPKAVKQVENYTKEFQLSTNQLFGVVVHDGSAQTVVHPERRPGNCILFWSGIWVQEGHANLTWDPHETSPPEFTFTVEVLGGEVMDQVMGPPPLTLEIGEHPAPENWNTTQGPPRQYAFFVMAPRDWPTVLQQIDIHIEFAYVGELKEPMLSSCA